MCARQRKRIANLAAEQHHCSQRTEVKISSLRNLDAELDQLCRTVEPKAYVHEARKFQPHIPGKIKEILKEAARAELFPRSDFHMRGLRVR
jgi:hypothetical protein